MQHTYKIRQSPSPECHPVWLLSPEEAVEECGSSALEGLRLQRHVRGSWSSWGCGSWLILVAHETYPAEGTVEAMWWQPCSWTPDGLCPQLCPYLAPIPRASTADRLAGDRALPMRLKQACSRDVRPEPTALQSWAGLTACDVGSTWYKAMAPESHPSLSQGPLL